MRRKPTLHESSAPHLCKKQRRKGGPARLVRSARFRFLGGNKRITFTAADVFLRRNRSYIDVTSQEGFEFTYGSMDRGEFRFARILD